MIFTFYSYKGGVGRSMALANVAEYFYRRGLRVVIIDWDLEAPGLETFFFDLREGADGDGAKEPGPGRKKVEEIKTQLGLLDLLLSYKRLYGGLTLPRGDAALGAKVAALREQLPSVSRYLYPIRPPGSLPRYPEAGLWILPAGWREGERFAAYSQGVQGFNWSDFYESFEGQAFFEWMRGELEQQSDVILIDSRTGVTEMGGVCTRQLADVVVSFAVLNHQNIEGVARMNRSFVLKDVLEARGRDLEVVAVPTRIDTNELASRYEMKKKFQSEMGEEPKALRPTNTSFWSLQIPYVSNFAYSERLAIGAPEAEELDKAYMRLATHLTLLAPDDSPLKARFSDDLRGAGAVEARAPAMAPPPPSESVRRPREFDELKAALVAENGERRETDGFISVFGPPGCGKSVLTAAVCRDRQVTAAFTDGVLWATLGPAPDVKAALESLYAEVTGDRAKFKSAVEASAALAQQLSSKSCLVVIDDVWSDAHLRPFSFEAPRCTRVVTSRVPPSGVKDAGRVLVGALDPEQSVRLLAYCSKRPDERHPQLASFAGRLKGRALLVKLAGDALFHSLGIGESLEGALQHLGQLLDSRGELAFDQTDGGGRARSVGASIAASLPLLGDEERERYARTLYTLAGGDASPRKLAEALGVGPEQAEELVKSWHALSLVTYDPGAATVSIHPALRAFLLEKLPAGVAADARAEQAFAALPPEKQALAARALPRLVRVQSATDPSRDAPHSLAVKDFDPAARALLQELTEARVVTTTPNSLTGEMTVQLADASLVGRWPRLRQWVNDDRQFLHWRQNLGAYIRDWKGSLRARSSLLRGEALGEAKGWQERRPNDLDETETTYIRESVSARNFAIVKWVAGIIAVAVLSVLLVNYIEYASRVSAEQERKQKEEQAAAAAELARKTREDQSRAKKANDAGLAALARGDVDAAILSFSGAINYFASSPDAYKNRGKAYLQKGYYDLALADLDSALQRGATDAETIYNRGVALYNIGDLNRASEAFQRALLANPPPDIAAQARKYLAGGVPTPTPPTVAPTPTALRQDVIIQ